jgi:uncharacterized PurR-regulated membrane protein YhhQ (DUF165 family)
MRTILICFHIAREWISNMTVSKPVQWGGIVVPAAIFIHTITLGFRLKV